MRAARAGRRGGFQAVEHAGPRCTQEVGTAAFIHITVALNIVPHAPIAPSKTLLPAPLISSKTRTPTPIIPSKISSTLLWTSYFALAPLRTVASNHSATVGTLSTGNCARVAMASIEDRLGSRLTAVSLSCGCTCAVGGCSRAARDCIRAVVRSGVCRWWWRCAACKGGGVGWVTAGGRLSVWI